VADIFFSYRSDDRERVRPVFDALAAQNFDVFWDQQVPAGVDWDTWIRQHLTQSKCVLVFWSATAVASDNVRHEATVAKQLGKLIPVLLEPLRADQFPMGLYTTQAISLAAWNGDQAHSEWGKLRREVEVKLTPSWVRRRIHELEAELAAERTRREAAEQRDKNWDARVAEVAREIAKLKAEITAQRDEFADYQRNMPHLRAKTDNLALKLLVAGIIGAVVGAAAADRYRLSASPPSSTRLAPQTTNKPLQ
jgi:hypothetical protein